VTPNEVRALVAEVFGIKPTEVGENLAFGEVAEWDSLNHVNLMLALEGRLGVEIGAEQMVELTSIAAIDEFAGASRSEG
jgi:citrate synthase